jgi:hypothetical protein
MATSLGPGSGPYRHRYARPERLIPGRRPSLLLAANEVLAAFGEEMARRGYLMNRVTGLAGGSLEGLAGFSWVRCASRAGAT